MGLLTSQVEIKNLIINQRLRQNRLRHHFLGQHMYQLTKVSMKDRLYSGEGRLRSGHVENVLCVLCV